MTMSKFSENLVDIYEFIDNKIKNENEKEKKMEFINDCIDWLKTLNDILIKRKKEIEEGK